MCWKCSIAYYSYSWMWHMRISHLRKARPLRAPVCREESSFLPMNQKVPDAQKGGKARQLRSLATFPREGAKSLHKTFLSSLSNTNRINVFHSLNNWCIYSVQLLEAGESPTVNSHRWNDRYPNSATCLARMVPRREMSNSWGITVRPSIHPWCNKI